MDGQNISVPRLPGSFWSPDNWKYGLKSLDFGFLIPQVPEPDTDGWSYEQDDNPRERILALYRQQGRPQSHLDRVMRLGRA